ncbi:hypothetical protein SAMN05519103_09629 [Rhizobiales bacterium GAS113]|nr:hypothetical protein SAMN05519103_09629 [Rhizobiales bacterium GAS113]
MRVPTRTMVRAETRKPAVTAAVLGTAVLLAVAGCQSTPVPTTVPTAQSIAGQSPAGTVTLTEIFVGGTGVGKGVLAYQGKKYPFRLIGTAIGPGGLSRINAAGEVYKLNDIADFPGPYAQGTGPVGLETAGASDLWLENKAGVIMHLTGTSSGVTLSLGSDEILIKMAK